MPSVISHLFHNRARKDNRERAGCGRKEWVAFSVVGSSPVPRINSTPIPTFSTLHQTVFDHILSVWSSNENVLDKNALPRTGPQSNFCLIVGNGIIWMDNVNCFGYETSLTQCRQVGWGLGNCDPLHREDAGVVCDNTTVEEVSNNYCRRLNNGSCKDLKVATYTGMFIYFR